MLSILVRFALFVNRFLKEKENKRKLCQHITNNFPHSPVLLYNLPLLGDEHPSIKLTVIKLCVNSALFKKLFVRTLLLNAVLCQDKNPRRIFNR